VKPSTWAIAAVVGVGAGLFAWWAVERARAPATPPAPDASSPAAGLLFEAKTLISQSDHPRLDLVKLGQAAEILDRAERLDPGARDPTFWRAVAAVMARDKEAALQAEGRLRKKSPAPSRDAALHYLRALILLEFEGKPREAVDEARLTRTLDPTGLVPLVDTVTWRALKASAAAFLQENKADQAVLALQEALKLVRNDPMQVLDLRRNLARAYGLAARYIEAEDEARAIVAENPGVAEFHLLLAQSLFEQHKWDDAAVEYAEVLRLVEAKRVPLSDVPRLEVARLRLGDCLRYAGKVEDGKREVERYVKEHPDDARGHYVLGQVYFDSLDDPERAIAAWETARRLAPWCDEPLAALLRVYEVARHDPVKARALREEIEKGKEARMRERVRRAGQSEAGLRICG
jgi:tetratricopeptide (TPR) repeat protein